MALTQGGPSSSAHSIVGTTPQMTSDAPSVSKGPGRPWYIEVEVNVYGYLHVHHLDQSTTLLLLIETR